MFKFMDFSEKNMFEREEGEFSFFQKENFDYSIS